MRLKLFAAALLIPLLAGSPARAQQPPATPSNPAHWSSVLELAQTLGQAHWIRILCNGDQDETWRRYMQDLLELEGRDGDQHTAMVGAFNQGFRSLRTQYRACNDEMKTVEGRLASHGRELADQLARSYLN